MGASDAHAIQGEPSLADSSAECVSHDLAVHSVQLKNAVFGAWSGLAHSHSLPAAQNTNACKLSNMSGDVIVHTDVQAASNQSEIPSEQAAIARALLIRSGVWSAGTEKHCEGVCMPCHYVHAAQGCIPGHDCSFCHLPHIQIVNTRGNRPCKLKRAYCHKIRGIIDNMFEDRSDQVAQICRIVSCQSSYMHSILQMPQDEQKQADAGQGHRCKSKVCQVVKPRSSMSSGTLTQSKALMQQIDADKKGSRYSCASLAPEASSVSSCKLQCNSSFIYL